MTKNLTSGRGQSFWFILEPLLMAKSTFQALTPEQQKAVTEVGLELEDFAFQAAKNDDQELVKTYAAKGAKINELTPEHIEKWRALARDTAWKDFAAQDEEERGSPEARRSGFLTWPGM